MRRAVDNLTLKMDYFQKMSSDEAISCRLAEAACGSKWKHDHPTHLKEVKAKFPQYAATFDKLGITEAMTSSQVLEHLKTAHLCDKKTCKKILRALDDDDPEAAIAAMGSKFIVTL